MESEYRGVQYRPGDDGINYVVVNDEGRSVGWGRSVVEAACNAADELYRPGSTFWHSAVAQILIDTSPEVSNSSINPFNPPTEEEEVVD